MTTNLLNRVFDRLDQERIDYALLRDFDRVFEASDGGDLDLLVRGTHLTQLEAVLRAYAFVRMPGWGYAPHHFFIGYDARNGSWLKLDVVTQISFGYPIATIPTGLADACLERRVKTGPIYTPSPEDELIILLLHCILDKRQFKPARQARLSELCDQVQDSAYLTALMQANGLPRLRWPQLAHLLETQDWTTLVGLGKGITKRLAGNRLLFETNLFVKRAQRSLTRKFTGGRPPSLMVALLAPDGAGKSSLSSGLRAQYYFPIKTIYMGLYQKQAGRPTSDRLPGMAFLTRLVRQEARFLQGWYHRQRRRLVIFDRYSYDALFVNQQRQGRIARLRRWLLGHACPDPDLVFVLDAPAEVLYSRKQEHDLQFIEKQRQFYLTLRDRLPQTRVIETTGSPETVRRQVIAQIWQGIANRQAGIAPHAPAPFNQPEAAL